MTNPSNLYVTTRGFHVRFLAIETLLDALKNSQAETEPKPPTYEVEIMGGGKEKHLHDASSIKQGTPEEVIAYRAYETQHDAWERQNQKEFLELILLKGIEVEEPEKPNWEADQKSFHIKVPEGEREKQIHYLITEVLGGMADVSQLVQGIMRVSGVSEDLLSQVEATFRRAVDRDTAKRLVNPSRQVDDQPARGDGLDRVQAGIDHNAV